MLAVVCFLILRLAIQVFSPFTKFIAQEECPQVCTRKGVSVDSGCMASGKALSRHLEQRRKFPGLARDPTCLGRDSDRFPVCPQKSWHRCLAFSELFQVRTLRARSRLCGWLEAPLAHSLCTHMAIPSDE